MSNEKNHFQELSATIVIYNQIELELDNNKIKSKRKKRKELKLSIFSAVVGKSMQCLSDSIGDA